MNKIIIFLMAALIMVACSRKEPPPSDSAETRGSTTNGASTAGLDGKIAGKWQGDWETKSPQEAITQMQLLLSESSGLWSGECKFTFNGNQSSNTRDVTVDSNGRISFRCNFASDSEFHFSGEVNGLAMKGTVEIFEKSQKVATGTWKARRA